MAKAKRRTTPVVKRETPPLVLKGAKVEFLWPGWLCPMYILSGTVTMIEKNGDGSYLYHVTVPRQERKKLNSTSPFPATVTARQTVIINAQIEGVERVRLNLRRLG